MSLFILTIPLMVLAMGAAVIPLIVVSHREHKRHMAELAAAGSKSASTAVAPQRVDANVSTRENRETVSPLAA